MTARRSQVKGVRLHDSRQTLATLQLSAGVHSMQVSKWLGHSSFTSTLDVYGDYIPEPDGGAVNNLPTAATPKSGPRHLATLSVPCFRR
jgi:integrase